MSRITDSPMPESGFGGLAVRSFSSQFVLVILRQEGTERDIRRRGTRVGDELRDIKWR